MSAALPTTYRDYGKMMKDKIFTYKETAKQTPEQISSKVKPVVGWGQNGGLIHR